MAVRIGGTRHASGRWRPAPEHAEQADNASDGRHYQGPMTFAGMYLEAVWRP